MEVAGSVPIAKPETVAEQRTTAAESHVISQPNDQMPPADEIAITELARISLLMPPQNTVKLALLQQAVFSGRYGPPAVTIAEAMIALAVSRGLKA